MRKRPERIVGDVARRLGLLGLIATVLVALLGVLAPAASASPTFHPQTRVAAIEQPAGHLVRPHDSVLADQGRPRAPNYDRTATGSSVAAEGGLNIDGANFAQTTAGNSFSSGGSFAGQTIGDVANDLKSGALSPDDVPIQVIVRDGDTLILNTRSALALEQAGIPRSEWVLDNVTGEPAAEARLSGQLARNGLGSGGTPTVRITGGG